MDTFIEIKQLYKDLKEGKITFSVFKEQLEASESVYKKQQESCDAEILKLKNTPTSSNSIEQAINEHQQASLQRRSKESKLSNIELKELLATNLLWFLQQLKSVQEKDDDFIKFYQEQLNSYRNQCKKKVDSLNENVTRIKITRELIVRERDQYEQRIKRMSVRIESLDKDVTQAQEAVKDEEQIQETIFKNLNK